jgi:hypothetical protein
MGAWLLIKNDVPVVLVRVKVVTAVNAPSCSRCSLDDPSCSMLPKLDDQGLLVPVSDVPVAEPPNSVSLPCRARTPVCSSCCSPS